MAEIINMPRLSDTMEEGTVAKWFKKVGDQINEGDILAEIETDKATMEFESFNEGELLHIGIHEGGTAPVDTLLAIIGKKGEDISNIIKGDSSEKKQNDNVSETAEIVSEENLKTVIPDEVEIIKMPRLSDTMEEGTVAKWFKKIGDKINEGDILAEIETDKATMEFESFYQGELLHIGLEEGQSAAVDSLLAIVGKSGTDVKRIISSLDNNPSSLSEATESLSTEIKDKSDNNSPIIEQDLTPVFETKINSNGRIIASPLAKKLAEEKGINLNSIKGSGESGRIIKRDIDSYTLQSNVSDSVKTFQPLGKESVTRIANSQMRKTIAKRLSSSKFSAPHYYLGVEFNMDNSISFRNQFNSLPDTKISFNDIIIKAVGLSLKHHPEVNAKWEDDQITQHHHVHLGVAVAVEDGLLVPVVKFANEQTLPQIGSLVKDYALRAREKKLKTDEMDGSTFTISNLGMFGIQEFTSIINEPNGAILSVGAIVKKPIVKDDKIIVSNTLKLTLACDHRVVDGATGAQFLQTLKDYIENPLKMIL